MSNKYQEINEKLISSLRAIVESYRPCYILKHGDIFDFEEAQDCNVSADAVANAKSLLEELEKQK